ncbi:MAG TPA: IclR family transcriptional regulator [Acidimicrobiia bacterium]|jgi:DNA-binding IclR family transcriptional regulator|nr:IclR family transcriptional regulator [Acidimicrobiia bacterium]
MNRVQSIDRAFLILERVATSEKGLTEIAEEVDLPKSTVARLLNTLSSIGAVDRVAEDGTYRIGDTVRGLVAGGTTTADFVQHARPYLSTLAHEFGEDAGVSVPVRSGVHYVAQEAADNSILVKDWTGTVAPYHLVPAGLVILAWLPETVLRRVLEGDLHAATARSVTEPQEVVARLARIRQEGYAWVRGELELELNSVAAPVFGQSGVIGAIGVHGPAYRFPGDRDSEQIARRVAEVAASLSDAHRTQL